MDIERKILEQDQAEGPTSLQKKNGNIEPVLVSRPEHVEPLARLPEPTVYRVLQNLPVHVAPAEDDPLYAIRKSQFDLVRKRLASLQKRELGFQNAAWCILGADASAALTLVGLTTDAKPWAAPIVWTFIVLSFPLAIAFALIHSRVAGQEKKKHSEIEEYLGDLQQSFLGPSDRERTAP